LGVSRSDELIGELICIAVDRFDPRTCEDCPLSEMLDDCDCNDMGR